MSKLTVKLEEFVDGFDKPIDLESATGIREWVKLYRKKYGKNCTGIEISAQLERHPEWMDEYGRKVWNQHQRRRGKENKENKDNDIDYEVRGSP